MSSSPTWETGHFSIPVSRNIAEYACIIAWWLFVHWLVFAGQIGVGLLTIVVILGCWTKTALFGAENLKQLYEAAHCNLAHHRFLVLMGINMSQMIMSFALDFHLLYCIDKSCFTGVPKDVGQLESLFDFFYLSTLNFSFFGYSDILPQTVPAKIINLTEIVLAFVTVIFLLSDFISLKDSIRNRS
ncbi:MAG TPA: ion channel [Pirellula sp.]|nr:ion channel [Pirellula sp.]